MSFMYPYVLFALALPILAAVVALYPSDAASRGWRKLVSVEHESDLVCAVPVWRRKLPFVLGIPALVLLILALARPYAGETQAEGEWSGRNLIIAIDVSRSMETDDVKPSRLEQARTAAYELLDALPEERVGLIVFSGEAELVVPLTYDHNALKDAIEQINRQWIATGGTNFGRVLSCAMETFRKGGAQGTNALIILSDGEDTTDTSSELAEEAKKDHLLVMTVGIGTRAGAPIPDASQRDGLYADYRGKHVVSKLDEKSMRAFAEKTDGDYFALQSGADLAEFARRAAERLDRREEKGKSYSIPNDCFEVFAIPALVMLVLAVVASAVWRTPHRMAMWVIVLLACGSPLQGASEEEVWERYFSCINDGKYEDAVRLIDDSFRDTSNNPTSEWQFARAYAAMKNKNDEEAKRSFSEALLSSRPALQAASFYEIGNLNVRRQFDALRRLFESEDGNQTEPSVEELEKIAQGLKEAVRGYDDALSIEPSHSSATINKKKTEDFIRLLQEEIERLKQQKNQQEQDNSQGDQAPQQKDDRQDKGNSQDQQKDDSQKDQSPENQNGKSQKSGNDNSQDRKQDTSDDAKKDKPDDRDSEKEDNRRKDSDQSQSPNEKQQDQNEQKGTSDHQGDGQQKQSPDEPSDKADNRSDASAREEAPDRDASNRSAPSQPEEQPDEPSSLTNEAREAAERLRAIRMLRTHVDEEKGSPLPVRPATRAIYPPEKDY